MTERCCVSLQLSQQEGELQRCQGERDEAALREKALEKKLQELEGEAETKANAKEDRARQVKLMEVTGEVSDAGSRLARMTEHTPLYTGPHHTVGAEPGRGASERRPADGQDRPGKRAGTAGSQSARGHYRLTCVS